MDSAPCPETPPDSRKISDSRCRIIESLNVKEQKLQITKLQSHQSIVEGVKVGLWSQTT